MHEGIIAVAILIAVSASAIGLAAVLFLRRRDTSPHMEPTLQISDRPRRPARSASAEKPRTGQAASVALVATAIHSFNAHIACYAASACILLAPAGCSKSPHYSVTEIRTVEVNGYQAELHPAAISSNGAVVGKARLTLTDFAFVWKSGKPEILSALGRVESGAEGVNEHGDIVGWFSSSMGACYAYALRDGKVRFLHNSRHSSSSANAINGEGLIVGTVEYRRGSTDACYWDSEGVHPLPSLGGGRGCAWDIGPNGVIVGWSNGKTGKSMPVRWQQGKIKKLPLLPGGSWGEARAVASADLIVGISDAGTGSIHAVLWRSGTIVDLGTLGGKNSFAQAVNAKGQVVGWTETEDGREVAFVWQRGKMYDLNQLTSISGGIVLHRARDVNASGSIVAEAARNGATIACVLDQT